MFIPSSSLFRMGEIERINARLFECNVGMDRDLYMRNQCSAKCCIICSNTEAWPPGYIEQLERGCVPVIRKKPWMKTFLTEDWPLVFTDKGEAVEMAKEVLKNYDDYRPLLESCLKERYSTDLNFGELLKKSWNNYLNDAHKKYSKES